MESDYPFCILEVQIREFLCNIQCEYCDIGRAGARRSTIAQRNDTDGLLARVRRNLANVQAPRRFPLLKIIGGEVFIVPGFAQWLLEIAVEYERVLVTTNGLKISADTLAAMGEAGNFVLQISLDGHDMEANRHRFTELRQLEVILSTVRRALELNLPVEINCVVTRANVGRLIEFAEFLEGLGGWLVLQPFPVRWRGNESWLDDDSAERFQTLVDSRSRWPRLLPPSAYLNQVKSFLATQRRTLMCTFPVLYAGMVDDGSLRLCNCLPLRETFVEGVADCDPGAVWDGNANLRRVLTGRPLSGMCNRCGDQFDILTLALSGAITLDELAAIPSYSGERFQRRFLEAKELLSRRKAGIAV